MEPVTQDDLDRLNVLINTAGVGTSGVDKELGAARADNPPVDGNAHIQAAHDHAAAAGEGFAAIQKWQKDMVAKLATKAPPMGQTEFVNRVAFDAYLPYLQQQVILDGAVVKSGFGPPMIFFTRANGSIGPTSDAPAEPVPGPIEPLPPPVHTPVGVIMLAGWGEEKPENTYRRTRFAKGQTYGVRFRVPPPPWLSAAPLVRGGFSYSSGSGACHAVIVEDGHAEPIPASTAGGGQASATQNPPVPGVYVLLMRGETEGEKDVQILVQVPQPGVRT